MRIFIATNNQVDKRSIDPVTLLLYRLLLQLKRQNIVTSHNLKGQLGLKRQTLEGTD